MDHEPLSHRVATAAAAARQRAATAHAAQGQDPEEQETVRATPTRDSGSHSPIDRDAAGARWRESLLEEGRWWLVRAPAMAVVIVLLAAFLSRTEASDGEVLDPELLTGICPASATEEWSETGEHHDGEHHDSGHGDHAWPPDGERYEGQYHDDSHGEHGGSESDHDNGQHGEHSDHEWSDAGEHHDDGQHGEHNNHEWSDTGDHEGDCPTEPEAEGVDCPADSSPAEPDPASPESEDPDSGDSDAGDRGSVDPAPGDPDAVDLGPVDPDAVAPDPVTPDTEDSPTAAETLGYTDPVFTDDFETFDEDRWFVYGGPSEHSYGEFYPDGGGLRTGEQISVDDGVMTITGLPNGNTAGMSTEESHQQQYGLWEVRTRIPAEAFNYHSVLILMAGEVELDFMEVLEPDGSEVWGFLHLDSGDDNGQVAPADDGWHNWAIEWTPDHIALYLDGEKWHETTPGSEIPTDPGTLTIQLDWFPEDHGRESTGTAELGVDWVNVYASPDAPATVPAADPGGETTAEEDGDEVADTPAGDDSSAHTDPDTDDGRPDCEDPGSTDPDQPGPVEPDPGQPDPDQPAPDPDQPEPDEPDPGADSPAPSDTFFVDPDNNAYAWAEANADDPRTASIVDSLASQAGAKWFGDWTPDINEAVSTYVDAAAASGSVPILAAYNIPNRDCGLYSSGGAGDEAEYAAWITAFAEGIGDDEAVVILEADALAQMLTCEMDDAAVDSRIRSLSHATAELAAQAPNAQVYLDAGSSGWVEPAAMADALDQVGVQDIRGFAVNVSNYKSTADTQAYGNAVNAALPAAQHFVIDTSRNGAAVDTSKWCNVRGAQLGETSRWVPDDPEVDAHLWIKFPGDSDGECTHDRAAAPDPGAGVFSPDLAAALITGDWSDLPD